MPIGGFVLTIDSEAKEQALSGLAKFPQAEIHGSDEKGNVILVIESETSKEMEKIVKDINKVEGVLNCVLTYINVEDE